MEVFSEPVELPCGAVVCANCIIDWVTITASSLCPCCYSDSPMEPNFISPPPTLILNLIKDVLVICPGCGSDVKTGSFACHHCTQEYERTTDLEVASTVIKQSTKYS